MHSFYFFLDFLKFEIQVYTWWASELLERLQLQGRTNDLEGSDYQNSRTGRVENNLGGVIIGIM